jgi:DNA-binding CsgD family transcriptional regulator
LICLKGSGLQEEKQAFLAAYPGFTIREYAIADWFSEGFFESKSIWHVYKV